MANKNRDDFLFTTQTHLLKPIDRTSFDHERHNVLIKGSHFFHKHIRTHSFRASIISNFLKSTPIDVVKEVIHHLRWCKHKDIKTTLQYKRGNISEDELKKIFSNLDKDRESQQRIEGITKKEVDSTEGS